MVETLGAKEALQRAKQLVGKAMFAKKIVTPAENRWWKFAPPARILLLLAAFHRLLPRAMPLRLRGVGRQQAPSADGLPGNSDSRQQLHGIPSAPHTRLA